MAAGIRRLLLLTIPSPVPQISAPLPNDAKLTLMRNPSRNVGELMADCLDAAVDRLVEDARWPGMGRGRVRRAARSRTRRAARRRVRRDRPKVRTVLAAAHTVEARLAGTANPSAARFAGGCPYPAESVVDLSGFCHRDRRPTASTDLARYLRALGQAAGEAAARSRPRPAADRQDRGGARGVRRLARASCRPARPTGPRCATCGG